MTAEARPHPRAGDTHADGTRVHCPDGGRGAMAMSISSRAVSPTVTAVSCAVAVAVALAPCPATASEPTTHVGPAVTITPSVNIAPSLTDALWYSSQFSPSSTVQAAALEYPGQLLSRGSRGETVAQVQSRLGIAADGEFGPRTESAVRSFQAGAGLVTDGIVGPLTWGALFGTSTAQPPEPTGGSGSLGTAAVAVAAQQIGKPYRYGGAGPNDFDCSGLIQYVYTQLGVSVPRTTYEQFDALPPVSRADVRPGDVIFFLDDQGQAYHDGLYAGGGQMIISRRPGTYVQYQLIWTDNYRIGRV